MREYILNPGGDADEIALYIGYVPERKTPAITVRHGTTSTVLGYLRDDESLEQFAEILARMLSTVAVRRIDGLAGHVGPRPGRPLVDVLADVDPD